MIRCIVDDCDNHDPVKGCLVSYNNHKFGPIACEYGRFVTNVTEKFGHLGKWKFRSISSYSNVLVATLNGNRGRVEVWGGTTHRDEVWAIPKGTSGCLISVHVTLESVEMACGRVGIQQSLAIQ